MTKFEILFFLALFAIVSPRPQDAPRPYDYKYKVDDPPTKNYFGHSETGDDKGVVEGEYYVLLPDGRLMNVKYFVDGESGFVPKISFKPGKE